MVDLYDGEVLFSDRQVGVIFNALRELSLDDNTIVIVTSDHGEEFLEHGGAGHGQSHYQELMRVPMIMAGPGIQARTVSTPVSLIDVMPTMLELAGLKPPPHLPGRSLADVVRSKSKEPPPRADSR